MRSQLAIGPWLAATISWLSATRGLSVPGCQFTAPSQTILSEVRTVKSDPRDRPPIRLCRLVPGVGITLTHDGRHLLASTSSGAVVVDVEKATQGSPDAVVGTLNGTAGTSAIEVITTPDGQYVFVSEEDGNLGTGYRGAIEVFNLHKPSANGFVSSTYIGALVLDYLVVGTVFSPDGHILYASSENVTLGSNQGSFSIIDVETLKTKPSKALLRNVTAGCSAVRCLVPLDGKTVWVTARASNTLLAFDAAKLLANSSDALVASVQVGTSPVGLISAKNESRIIAADSNRFNYIGATTGLSVVDVQAALRGERLNTYWSLSTRVCS